MIRTRFSIAGLMGFVLFVALGIGGLKAANPIWASLWYSLAFVVLIAGVLLSIQARGRKRAFWVGFSVAGWAYFVFGFVFPYGANYESPPQFFPALLLVEAHALFFPDVPSTVTATYNPLTVSVATPPVLGGSPPPPAPLPPAPPLVALNPLPTPTQPAIVFSSPPSEPPTTSTATSSPMPPPPLPVSPAPPPATLNFLPTTTITASALSSTTFTMGSNGSLTPMSVSAIESLTSFNHVGQSMMTLILAYLGGWFSLLLWTRRERNEANSTPEISPSSP